MKRIIAHRIPSLFAAAVAAFSLPSGADISVTTNGTVVTVAGAGELHEAFLAPDVTAVIFDGGSDKQIKYFPAAASTYTGGTKIAGGQLFVSRGDSLGSGSVEIGTTTEAALMAKDCEVMIPNKVEFARSGSYAVGFGDSVGRLTLKALGTKGSQYHTVRLGRAIAGNVGRVTLSLTDEASDPVSRYILQGNMKLTLDGGTIKARQDATIPFFALASAATAEITVTTNGVTFDAVSGATLQPGQPMTFQAAREMLVRETCYPENWDFEDNTTGSPWVFTCYGVNRESSVKTSPTAWDGQGAYPPHEKRYAMLRKQTVLSTDVNVPSEGMWRVSFLRGCRSGFSSGMTLSVIVDGVTNTTFAAISGSYDCNFTNLVSEPVPLAAGSHTIAFDVYGAGESTYSLNIDAVTLERVETLSIYGTVKKTGEGQVILSGQDLIGVPVVAEAGTLTLNGTTLQNGTVTVKSGAVVEIEDTTVGEHINVVAGGTNVWRNSMLSENTAISVAAGGVLCLTDFGANIVANGSFEQNGPQTYAPGTIPTGWTWTREENLGTINDNGGMQGDGGTLSASGPYTPAGSVTAFLREACSFKQQISCTAAGKYRVSLLAADRKGDYHSERVPIYVKVGDDVVLTIPARESCADYTRYSVDVDLAAGNYELKILTGKAATPALGSIVFVDDVRVCKIEPLGALENGEIRFASGAEINLDLVDGLDVKKVFVNGVQIRGGNATLRNAGVIVTGSGKIQAGSRRGIAISFK